MEPKGAPIGPPTARPSAGDPVRIWFRLGLPCSPPPNGLVGDGTLRSAEQEWVGGLKRAGDVTLKWEGDKIWRLRKREEE